MQRNWCNSATEKYPLPFSYVNFEVKDILQVLVEEIVLLEMVGLLVTVMPYALGQKVLCE